MTLAVIPSPEAARALTDRIKVAVEGTWELIKQAYSTGAWAALGYGSWDDYCTREFGTSRLRLPREERQEVVASLRDSGLSIRAIASVTGDSRETVRRVIAPPDTNVSPLPDRAVDDDLSDDEDSWDDRDSESVAEDMAAIVDDAEDEHGWDDEPALTEEECEALARPEDLEPEPVPTITGVDGKTYPATRPTPKAPAETAQQREDRVRREQNRRDADRLEQFVNGWITFSRLPEIDDRADILALLIPEDRAVIDKIAGMLGWNL